MAKVHGNTLFSAAVRSIVENGEKWEIVGNELVNSCGDIFIPVSTTDCNTTDNPSTCVVQIGEEFYTPFASYFCIDANGETKEISFC